jgi:hypothetical protein
MQVEWLRFPEDARSAPTRVAGLYLAFGSTETLTSGLPRIRVTIAWRRVPITGTS